ncbi:hypothetical protein [Streptomyces sp. NPDC088725]|uniref:hypothetical protein n=1 Tax=Streptomyces sp. NPDC088725 TaxID=3365873 RepID=UPI0037F9AAF6
MAAPARTRFHPQSSGRAEVRLPWWAVVLPSLAFAALLLLVVHPSRAHAATGGPGVGRIAEQVQRTLAR